AELAGVQLAGWIHRERAVDRNGGQHDCDGSGTCAGGHGCGGTVARLETSPAQAIGLSWSKLTAPCSAPSTRTARSRYRTSGHHRLPSDTSRASCPSVSSTGTTTST